ncbi:hypothetical protein [Curtobacterium sp. MCBD17_040]|uniref:hypothetical protein n=1 Tax=Curtobacterium sp. MCBD17_040 TaxID=2175674 RepID=UPI0011B845CB|nr:hypothetical protein [Curtobacterium sp. MCBD17_040]WIB65316.1 hypothetical protein DEI94_18085 [Curtobacterium sp. MCBD17_040]
MATTHRQRDAADHPRLEEKKRQHMTNTPRRTRFITAVAACVVFGTGAAALIGLHHAGTAGSASDVKTEPPPVSSLPPVVPKDLITTTDDIRTVIVWTAGGQADINKCAGAVDITAIYGVRTIAEHDRCGGSTFPTRPGTLVHLTGLDAGMYRVSGVIAHLNGRTESSADIPRGYDLIFQTCSAGYTDMTFTGLTRIG